MLFSMSWFCDFWYVGTFVMSVFRIITSCKAVGVKELMFWFRLLPLMGILSIGMGWDEMAGIPGRLRVEWK